MIKDNIKDNRNNPSKLVGDKKASSTILEAISQKGKQQKKLEDVFGEKVANLSLTKECFTLEQTKQIETSLSDPQFVKDVLSVLEKITNPSQDEVYEGRVDKLLEKIKKGQAGLEEILRRYHLETLVREITRCLVKQIPLDEIREMICRGAIKSFISASTPSGHTTLSFASELINKLRGLTNIRELSSEILSVGPFVPGTPNAVTDLDDFLEKVEEFVDIATLCETFFNNIPAYAELLTTRGFDKLLDKLKDDSAIKPPSFPKLQLPEFIELKPHFLDANIDEMTNRFINQLYRSLIDILVEAIRNLPACRGGNNNPGEIEVRSILPSQSEMNNFLDDLGFSFGSSSPLENLLEDFSLIVTPRELCHLLEGKTGSENAHSMFRALVEKKHPEFKILLEDKSVLEKFFDLLGDLSDLDLCRSLSEMDYHADSCEGQEDQDPEKFKKLLIDGVSPDKLEEELEKSRQKRRKSLEKYVDILGNSGDFFKRQLEERVCQRTGKPSPLKLEIDEEITKNFSKGLSSVVKGVEFSYTHLMTSYPAIFLNESTDVGGNFLSGTAQFKDQTTAELQALTAVKEAFNKIVEKEAKSSGATKKLETDLVKRYNEDPQKSNLYTNANFIKDLALKEEKKKETLPTLKKMLSEGEIVDHRWEGDRFQFIYPKKKKGVEALHLLSERIKKTELPIAKDTELTMFSKGTRYPVQDDNVQFTELERKKTFVVPLDKQIQTFFTVSEKTELIQDVKGDKQDCAIGFIRDKRDPHKRPSFPVMYSLYEEMIIGEYNRTMEEISSIGKRLNYETNLSTQARSELNKRQQELTQKIIKINNQIGYRTVVKNGINNERKGELDPYSFVVNGRVKLHIDDFWRLHYQEEYTDLVYKVYSSGEIYLIEIRPENRIRDFVFPIGIPANEKARKSSRNSESFPPEFMRMQGDEKRFAKMTNVSIEDFTNRDEVVQHLITKTVVGKETKTISSEKTFSLDRKVPEDLKSFIKNKKYNEIIPENDEITTQGVLFSNIIKDAWNKESEKDKILRFFLQRGYKKAKKDLLQNVGNYIAKSPLFMQLRDEFGRPTNVIETLRFSSRGCGNKDIGITNFRKVVSELAENEIESLQCLSEEEGEFTRNLLDAFSKIYIRFLAIEMILTDPFTFSTFSLKDESSYQLFADFILNRFRQEASNDLQEQIFNFVIRRTKILNKCDAFRKALRRELKEVADNFYSSLNTEDKKIPDLLELIPAIEPDPRNKAWFYSNSLVLKNRHSEITKRYSLHDGGIFNKIGVRFVPTPYFLNSILPNLSGMDSKLANELKLAEKSGQKVEISASLFEDLNQKVADLLEKNPSQFENLLEQKASNLYRDFELFSSVNYLSPLDYKDDGTKNEGRSLKFFNSLDPDNPFAIKSSSRAKDVFTRTVTYSGYLQYGIVKSRIKAEFVYKSEKPISDPPNLQWATFYGSVDGDNKTTLEEFLKFEYPEFRKTYQTFDEFLNDATLTQTGEPDSDSGLYRTSFMIKRTGAVLHDSTTFDVPVVEVTISKEGVLLGDFIKKETLHETEEIPINNPAFVRLPGGEWLCPDPSNFNKTIKKQKTTTRFVSLFKKNLFCRRILQEKLKKSEKYRVLFELIMPIEEIILTQSLYNITFITNFTKIEELFASLKNASLHPMMGLLHSNFAETTPLLGSLESFQELVTFRDLEGDPGEFSGFDLAGMILRTPFYILKGLVETFDPNVSIAKRIADATNAVKNFTFDKIEELQQKEREDYLLKNPDKTEEDALERFPNIGEKVPDMPVLIPSLGLMASALLFPTPFGGVYLGLEATEGILRNLPLPDRELLDQVSQDLLNEFPTFDPKKASKELKKKKGC